MEVIRSRHNPLLRRLRQLADDPAARRVAQRCVIQGERLIRDWVANGGAIECLVELEGAAPDVRAEAASQGQASAGPVEPAAAVARVRVGRELSSALDRIGGASGPLALAVILEHAEPGAGGGDVLYLDGIQDPGNVGTILRAAAAFGVVRVVPGPGCADLWSPKVLRAAMGAHPRLQLHAAARWLDFGARMHRILRAADPDGTPADQLDLRLPGIWILGAEGRGLSLEVRSDPHVGRVAVPMVHGVDSLNAAMAQGILLYEQHRQRRRTSSAV